ncbi:hypothetical protein [Candidatus Darwinibacter acetoxidans]
MELTFEHSQKIADGHTPQAWHSPDQICQVLYTDATGRIYSVDTETPFGNFADRTFTAPLLAAPDTGARHLTIAYLPRMNLWANWLTGNTHRQAVFLLKQETNKYLVDGSMTFSDDDPGVSLSLTLENPAGIIAAEGTTEVPPGTRVSVYFRIGDSSRIALGQYYLDRIVTAVGNPRVDLTARNVTGKLLKDQTFDEDNTFSGTVTAVLVEMLEDAGVVNHRVESVGATINIEFPPNMSYFDGLQSVISTRNGWQMREDASGTIIIGSPAYVQLFMPPGTYSFERGRDCFGREVTRDDRETYSRVCVHDREFAVKAWRDVQFIETWNLPRKKTLYVEAPEGTTQAQAAAKAEYLAGRLADVGVIESFVAPFRPQIQPGDAAEIAEPDRPLPRLLGTITQVGFRFGRSGFFTDFTVDSGGVVRKPRIRDLIEQISGRRDVGSAKIS